MKKETLRYQRLAGIITESQYSARLEENSDMLGENLIEEDLVNEIDYDRSLDINDFYFLNNGERIFSGWYVEESGDEFLIKNKEFPFFEFAVFIGTGSRGSAQEYPWGYEARSTGGSNYSPHGHKGKYIIEKNNASNIERAFKHFLTYRYDSIRTTSRY